MLQLLLVCSRSILWESAVRSALKRHKAVIAAREAVSLTIIAGRAALWRTLS